ncbi:unnamed protein product [marine sediment metagenome]|uniref:DUF433 domain-containing protein n=1 Tax=marine sediment metagenome TaxID=412755 RepID=X1EZH8_9ZZZZ
MSTRQNPKIQEKKTLRPFIITSREICNGSPVIKGTRTRVIDIAIEYRSGDISLVTAKDYTL